VLQHLLYQQRQVIEPAAHVGHVSSTRTRTLPANSISIEPSVLDRIETVTATGRNFSPCPPPNPRLLPMMPNDDAALGLKEP